MGGGRKRVWGRRGAGVPSPEKDAIASIAMATMREGSGAVPCSKESCE